MLSRLSRVALSFALVTNFIVICQLQTSSAEDLFTIVSSPRRAADDSAAVLSRTSTRISLRLLDQDYSLAMPGKNRFYGKAQSVKENANSNGSVTKTVTGETEGTDFSGPKGEYVFSYTQNGKENAFHGNIRTADGHVYNLEGADDNVVFKEIDSSQQLDCGGGAKPHEHDLISHPISRSIAKAEPSTQASSIRLLVAYTPDAIAEAGSEAAVLSAINAMVENTNLAHANSQTGVTMTLAGTYLLSTPSSDNFEIEIGQATDTTDGKWDELGTLRQQYCADMVSVVVGGTNGETICGIAWIGGNANVMPLYVDLMFSIISVNTTICSEYTFAHELAHNLGSDHDLPNSSGGSPAYGYSYGQYFIGNSNQAFRTVMAYARRPPEAAGIRIPYFSNPNVSYDGKPTGVVGLTDNASSIFNTSPVVASFYAEGEGCATAPPISNPPAAPNAISFTATTKTRNNSTKVTFQAVATNNGTAVAETPLEFRYDPKKTGTFETVIKAVATNAKGVASYKASLEKLKKGFYVACYLGATQETTVCSSLIRKR